MKTDAPSSRVYVWDLPVRVVHWAIALLILASWWTQEADLMAWHRRSGYLIAALLAFRLVWGVGGGQTARFANFVKGPKAIIAYLKGETPDPLGHNPLGALSVVALYLALGAHILIGALSIDEEGFEAGPLAQFISFDAARGFAELHEWTFRILMGLIVLHLAAIAWYFAKGRNLVRPMISGWMPTPLAMPQPAPARPWALAVGVIVGVAVFGLLTWLNARAGLA